MSLTLIYNNGWESGNWELIGISIFHDQVTHRYSTVAVTWALFGFTFGIGISYDF